MNFPEIKLDSKDKCWTMPGKTYIADYLMPLIGEAAKRGECTMIFHNVDKHMTEYAFTKLTDVNHLRSIYGTETKCGTTSVGCPTSRTLQTSHTFTVPSHKEISQAFIQLGGYVVPHCDNKYFILNWSNFMKNESKTVSEDAAIGGSSVTMDSNGNKTEDEKMALEMMGMLAKSLEIPLDSPSFPYKLENFSDGKVTLSRTKESYCEICDRNHKNVNAVLYTVGPDLNVLFNCRRANISLKIGSFGVSQTKGLSINDFFYSAALQALKEKGSVEIHFLQAALGKVLCIKPPSSEFIGFTTDLILLIDQRNKLGYEVSYRYGSHQETLIVMTFPVSTAKKMIAELQI